MPYQKIFTYTKEISKGGIKKQKRYETYRKPKVKWQT